jgi:competence protein ComEC
MAGIPILALRYNTKKLAAFFAIIGVMLYLVVCGAPIPALRAFIMTSLILGAVMLDRFAISLRNVAIAATFILIFIPEALLSPSFQLSFAAVTVLVAGYERYYTSLQSWIARKPWLGKTVCVYFFGVILSTVLSTIATTPYVIYTFHHFTLHSIPANMIVIPLISFFIMPLLAVYIIFWPITESMGLSSVLHYLLNTMTDIATYVAGWQGSHILVRSMPIESLLLATFGLLLFFLVKHMLRFVGLGLMFFSAIYMFYADLPWAFIGKKSLIGIYDIENGIQVNSLSKERFARKSWMSFCGLDKVRKNQNILADNHDLKAFLEKHHDLRSAYIWRNGNELKCTSVQDTEGVRPWSL